MHQALGTKHKEPSWLIGLLKGYIISTCFGDEGVIYTSVQTVQLYAQNSPTVVETKMELDSHSVTCVAGDHFLIVHDYNRTVNVFRYGSKVGSNHACIVNTALAYTEPEIGQVVILLINQPIDMKGLDHHILCPMQCCMNVFLINDVPKFLAPVPGETMHAIHH